MASKNKTLPIPAHKLGVVADEDPESMPLGALVAAENWIYDDGFLKLRPGFTAFGNDVDQRPEGFAQYPHNDGLFRIVKATTLGWWKLNGAVYTDITGDPLTGTPTDLQVFRVFQKSGETHLLGTNGANTMKKWNGSAGTYSNVGGSPPRCKTMMILNDRVIIGNLLSGGTVSPLGFDVSAFQNFDSGWSSILVGLAGIETEGGIVAMQESGNLVGSIYKDDAIVDAISQDSGDPIRLETRRTRIAGPCSALGVIAPADGLHLVFANNGAIMRNDSGSYNTLGRKFQAWINKTANLTNLNRGFAFYDSNKNHAWFFYPEVGSTDPKIGIVINLNNMSMWPFRLPWTISAAGGVQTTTGLTVGQLPAIGSITQTIGELSSANPLKRMMVGETGGQSYEIGGVKDGAAKIPFMSQSGRTAMTDGRRYKTVNEIEHRFTKCPGSQEITVQVGISDHGDEEVLGAAQVMDLSEDGPHVTEHRESGKFLSMRMSGEADQPITYRGSYVNFVERGYR